MTLHSEDKLYRNSASLRWRHTVPKLTPYGCTIKEIFKFKGDRSACLTLLRSPEEIRKTLQKHRAIHEGIVSHRMIFNKCL